MLEGRIKGYTSVVPSVLEGAFKDEELLEAFLGSDGACKGSPVFFFAHSGTCVEMGVLARNSLVGGKNESKETLLFLYHLQPQQWRLGF